MIGGPPIYFAPAPVSMLPPGYGPVPYSPPVAPRPASPVRIAQASALPPAIIRGQMADDVGSARSIAAVAMPAPDQLGVNAHLANGACDWTAIHRRVQELGVVSFQMDRLSPEVYQITCLVPAEANHTHRIEAHGATEAEAARCALDEVQRWKSQR